MDDLQRSIESKLEVHHKIEAVLGLSCVFLNENPVNAKVDTTRCMLEISDCQGSRSVHRQCDYEDVVVRMRHLKSVDRHAELGNIRGVLSRVFSELDFVSVGGSGADRPLAEHWDFRAAPHPQQLHPGIAPILKVVESASDLFTVHRFHKHSMLSMARFHCSTTLSSASLGNTAGLGARDLRLRFIVYQLVQATAFIHRQGLCLDPVVPNNVMLDDDMWLYLPIGLSDRMCSSLGRSDGDGAVSPAIDADRPDTAVVTAVDRPIGHREPLTHQWITGKLSNFEYLMAINYAAGRTMMDPLYHPIIPWVTDFSCYPTHDTTANGGLRDLTKSKFRLSKGDAQLETTYKHSDPPHHIPESLSELTYYIYLARRTPLQVLRRVVRDVFVPEHYPHSMSRIYEWTPDECIPEFFTDPCMLTSIHAARGLRDIELPYFASSPSEFISFHRSVLESPEVSKHLHQWIDITFGYCLSGDAAVANMNVPLYHTLSSARRTSIDSPDVNKNPGFVILFDHPHPCKHMPYPSRQTSSKPAPTPPYSDAFGLRSFLSLDHGTRKTDYGTDPKAAIRVLQTNFQLNVSSPESSSSIGIGSPFKKSLLHPRSPDPSLKHFSSPHLQDLRLVSPDEVGCAASAATAAGDRTMKQQLSFAIGSALDAVYELPTITDDPGDDSSTSDLLCWDEEFRLYANNVLQMITHSRRQASRLSDLQAEDMLAIGCILAEIHLGRPLMNRMESADLAHRNAGIDRTLQFVYRKGRSLPLVIRRLSTVLLSPDPALRPTAEELLQACMKANFDMFDDKAYSLQRSGGNEPGYVDFESDTRDTGTVASRQEYDGRTVLSASSVPQKLVTYLERETIVESLSIRSNERVELLSSYCANLFPSYFKTVYRIIGELKLCADDDLRKMRVALGYLDVIADLPLDGLNLMLRHLIHIVGNADPFSGGAAAPDETQQDSNGEGSPGRRKEQSEGLGADRSSSLASTLREYYRIVDVIGWRLGMAMTETVLIPRVLDFLGGLKSVDAVETILRTPLWSVLVLRSGVTAFLRYFMPVLLTYISASTLRFISNGSVITHSSLYTLPLWAKGQHRHAESNLWLCAYPLHSIKEVEQAAMSAFFSLVEPEAMGLGLGSRYVLPALLSLIGNPQLAGAGYEQQKGSAAGVSRSQAEHLFNELALHICRVDAAVPDEGSQSATTTSPLEGHMDQLEAYISHNAVFEPQDRYVTRTVINLCMQLGDLVVSELILSRLFNDTLTELALALLSTAASSEPIESGVVSALMEVLLLLGGILPSLHNETVLKDFLCPSKITGMSLPKLLSMLPLSPMWSIYDAFAISQNKCLNIDAFIHARRFNNMVTELCRLIVASCTCAGLSPNVLPAVDTFFRNFVDAFAPLPIESRTMGKGFAIAGELFLPLAQISGPSAFYSTVPHLNPRLEMWLVSIGSNIVAKSPPLPDTIWPPLMSKEEKKVTKNKGFMQWISGKISSSSSSIISSTKAESATHFSIDHHHPGVDASNRDSSFSYHGGKSSQQSKGIHQPKYVEYVESVPVDVSATLTSGAAPPHPTYEDKYQLTAQEDGTLRDDRSIETVKDEQLDKQVAIEVDAVICILPLQDVVDGNDSDSEEEQVVAVAEEVDFDTPEPSVGVVATLESEEEEEEEAPGDQSSSSSALTLFDGSVVAESVVLDTTDLLIAVAAEITDPSSVFDGRDSIAHPFEHRSSHLTKDTPSSDSATPTLSPFTSYQRIMSTASKRMTRSNVRSGLLGSLALSRKQQHLKMSSLFLSYDMESLDDIENRELYYNEMAWLLAGEGRWNVDKDLRDKAAAREQMRMGGGKLSLRHASNFAEWTSAAQLSMTTPRITTDASSDANSLFTLQMQSNTQWRLEDSPGVIRCMATNALESLLITCSRTGVRLWSLSTNPLTHVSSYSRHSVPPFNAGFLHNGIHAATCDGNIHVWDIESRHTIAFLNATSNTVHTHHHHLDRSIGFSSMTIVPAQFGIVPCFGSFGDNQLLTTLNNILAYHDMRSNYNKSVSTVAEWIIPQIPAQGGFISSIASEQQPLQLTCAASEENYLYAGSSAGGLWVVDRRMGKLLSSWQAHDGPVLKLQPLSDKHVLSVSDRSAAVWEYNGNQLLSHQSKIPYAVQPLNNQINTHVAQDEVPTPSPKDRADPLWMGLGGQGEVKKVLSIKNMPVDNIMSASTILLPEFEYRGAATVNSLTLNQEKGVAIPTKLQYVLYCVSGNKLHAAKLPSFDKNLREAINVGNNAVNDTGDIEELRLSQSYFLDRKGVKIPRSKLNVTSAVLLPLRKLLLVGTDDGLVRIVS